MGDNNSGVGTILSEPRLGIDPELRMPEVGIEPTRDLGPTGF